MTERELTFFDQNAETRLSQKKEIEMEIPALESLSLVSSPIAKSTSSRSSSRARMHGCGDDNEDQENREPATPCKSASKTSTPTHTTPRTSSGGNRRIHTRLNSLKNLPPLKKQEQDVGESDHHKAPMTLDTPQKQARPAWNSSTAQTHQETTAATPARDTRMRKPSLSAGIKAVEASPRTPHVSQINAKRQRQQSQLARPALPLPRAGSATFAVPPPPVTGTRPKVGGGGGGEEAAEWKRRYEQEVKARSQLELELTQERKERVKLEMEYRQCLKRLQELSTPLGGSITSST